MKSLMVCAGLLAAVSVRGQVTYQTPLDYYPLNESSGATAHDAMTANRSLTTTSIPNNGGTTPTWSPTGGPFGFGAINFAASGVAAQEFFSSGSTAIVSGYPYTTACWMNSSNTTTTGAQEWMFFGDGTASMSYTALGMPNTELQLPCAYARNTTQILAVGPNKIADGNWHQVVGVYASATSRLLYVDGVASATNTTSVTCPNMNRIGIGGLTRSAPTDPVQNGAIADVGVWNAALSPQQIALIHGLGVFQQVGLNDSSVSSLLGIYNARTGTAIVGTNVWGYASGLSGAIGATGGSDATATAYVVLDGSGNGVQIQGVAQQPLILGFTANPSAINLGASVTLNWNTFNTTGVSINQGVGSVAATGSTVVTPANTTTYTLTATGTGGTITSNVTVSVNLSPIFDYFTSSPLPDNVSQFYPGTPVTLAWEVDNASGTEILPGVGSVATTGTVVVNPTVTTTYLLVYSNTYANTLFTNSVTVLVGAMPTPVDYYPLNESSGTIAHDGMTNNARNLTTSSNPNSGSDNPTWEPTGGPIGGALFFNATAQTETAQAFQWTTNAASPGLVVADYPLTFACWVQIPNYQSGWEQNFVFLGDDTSSANYQALDTRIGSQGGFPGYATQVARTGSTTIFYNNDLETSIVDGNWHHLVAVYLSATNRIIYVDGAYGATDNNALNLNTCNTIGLGVLTRSVPTDAYNGGMADVGIWSQALSPQEIALVNGLGVFEHLSLTNSAIPALEAVYFAGSGSVQIGAHTWVYTNGLSGATGSIGGDVADQNAYIVLDDNGNGVALAAASTPFIAGFSADPNSILVGSSVTLNWNVLNATSVSIDQGIGSVANSGTLTVTPANTTTYTLIAQNASGASTNSITVAVNLNPVINYFSVPAAVFQYYPGDPVTLSWNVANSTAQTITPGVGVVSSNGTVTVYPTTNTTYVLTAGNTYSTNVTISSVAISVVPVAPPQLMIHWGCNEGAGTNLYNSISTNWTGDFLSHNSDPNWALGYGVFGGPALDFNGGDTTPTIRATDAAVTNYPFTIVAWYNVTNATSYANYTLASLPSPGNGNNYASLGVNQGNPYVAASYNPPALNTVYTTMASAPNNVSDGNWHQLIGVFESSTDRKIYVDGGLGSNDLGTTIDFDVPDCFSIGALDIITTAGAHSPVAGPANQTQGEMDEVALYSGRLLANDVAILYGAAAGLGLNTADAETLRATFVSGTNSYVTVTNGVWQRAVAQWPGQPIGATGGSLAAQNAYVVMDGSGDGMAETANVKPTITTEPQGDTNYVGATVMFSVQAFSSAPVNYQWSSSVSGTLIDQTNATLTLTNVQVSQAGTYTVNVSNGLGSTNSLPAVLSVVRPGISQGKIQADGNFGFAASGIPGTSISIQASAALTGPWTTLTNLVIGADGMVSFEDSTTPRPATQFYQTVVNP